ncbi:MAG: LemA family protein, partial [Candidatus Brocadiaceae bacterium]
MYLAAGIAAGVLLLWGVVTFNRLIRLRNMVREGWSGIDVQLKRRYDLVTRLEEVVRRYAEHEQRLFPEVARLRSRAAEAVGPAQQGEAENALTGGLRSLFAVAEQYPDIKANENFLDLQ